LKVEYDHDESLEGQKLAQEIARTVKRIYSVRTVEIQNTISEEFSRPEE